MFIAILMYTFAAINKTLHKYNILIMALSIEDRKFIQSGLPHGAQSEIANELGVSRSAIYQYLTGVRYNKHIEEAVVNKYEVVKKQREELRRKIYE